MKWLVGFCISLEVCSIIPCLIAFVVMALFSSSHGTFMAWFACITYPASVIFCSIKAHRAARAEDPAFAALFLAMPLMWGATLYLTLSGQGQL
jgi:hypothetical protein